MLFIYLILLYCAVFGLTKRSEDSFIRNYYMANSHKHNNHNFVSYLLAKVFIANISHQSLIALLIIGGIEPNPGPRPQQMHDEDQFYDCSATKICPCPDLCPVKHLCSLPDCDDDIFASCHCDKCKGYGPLLCYNHFINDICPHSYKPSTKESRSPTNLNQQQFQKSRLLRLITSKSVSVPSELECSTCFRTFAPDSIGIDPRIVASMQHIEGLFIYVCKACLKNQSNDAPAGNTQNAKDKTDGNRISFCRCRVVTHKRHLHRITTKASGTTCSKAQLSNNGPDDRKALKPVALKKVTPLLSLDLKPPSNFIMPLWLLPNSGVSDEMDSLRKAPSMRVNSFPPNSSFQSINNNYISDQLSQDPSRRSDGRPLLEGYLRYTTNRI